MESLCRNHNLLSLCSLSHYERFRFFGLGHPHPQCSQILHSISRYGSFFLLPKHSSQQASRITDWSLRLLPFPSMERWPQPPPQTFRKSRQTWSFSDNPFHQKAVWELVSPQKNSDQIFQRTNCVLYLHSSLYLVLWSPDNCRKKIRGVEQAFLWKNLLLHLILICLSNLWNPFHALCCHGLPWPSHWNIFIPSTAFGQYSLPATERKLEFHESCSRRKHIPRNSLNLQTIHGRYLVPPHSPSQHQCSILQYPIMPWKHRKQQIIRRKGRWMGKVQHQ